MRITTLCVFVSAVLVALILHSREALAQQTTPARALVLKGATVIDGYGQAPVPDAVIVIEGDKIKSVGGKGKSYPSEAAVLDLSGKFVVPGLVDMHVHYRPWLGELFLNYGVTSIAVPGNPDYEAADRDTSNQPETRAPRIYSTSGRPLVTANMKREQVRDAVRAGQDIVEHMWGFAEALMTAQELEDFHNGKYLHWGLFLKDQARIDPMIKDAVANGTYLNPTLVYELGSQTALARD